MSENGESGDNDDQGVDMRGGDGQEADLRSGDQILRSLGILSPIIPPYCKILVCWIAKDILSQVV